MLARAGFGDNPLLAHAQCQQRLAQAVIDLVRTGMQQVFALDVDLCATQAFAEAFCVVQRRWPPRVGMQQMVELFMELGVLLRFVVGPLQFFERRHQHFGNVAPAVGPEVPASVRLCSDHLVLRAVSINCFMRA